MQDTQYRSPKAELHLRFTLPVLNGSVENAARLELFTALVIDQLNEVTYPAALAGLTYEINAHARGFDLAISGYTDKQSLLVNKLIEAIAAPNFTSVRFEKVKDDVLQHWKNNDKNLPYAVLAQKIFKLQFMPYWEVRELTEALRPVSAEQFKSFANDAMRGAKLNGFFYGNIYAQDTLKLATLIEHQLLQKTSNRVPQLAKVLRVDHKNSKSWLYSQSFEHNDHVTELYIPALSNTAEDAAYHLLLTQLLEAPFYNQLRTEKQLGYVVSVSAMPLRNLEASLFIIQSPHVGSENLMQEINAFLQRAPAEFAVQFAENKNALLAQLREPALSLHDQAEKYWQAILLGDTNFAHEQAVIAAVNKITLEQLSKYYEVAFLQKNHRLWLVTDKVDTGTDFDVIQNVAEYQQKMQGYFYP
jgi:insulysin